MFSTLNPSFWLQTHEKVILVEIYHKWASFSLGNFEIGLIMQLISCILIKFISASIFSGKSEKMPSTEMAAMKLSLELEPHSWTHFILLTMVFNAVLIVIKNLVWLFSYIPSKIGTFQRFLEFFRS